MKITIGVFCATIQELKHEFKTLVNELTCDNFLYWNESKNVIETQSKIYRFYLGHDPMLYCGINFDQVIISKHVQPDRIRDILSRLR